MNTKPKKDNRLWPRVVLILIFIVGTIIALYPFYVNAVNNFIDQQRVASMQHENQQTINRKVHQFERENAKLARSGLHPESDPFAGSGRQVKLNLKRHLIGSINIPKIKTNIPLFDTTNNTTLNYGATVVQGTSFPLGGKSTHAVIAGHRGLPERNLFSDLNLVKKGNIFVLTVLKHKLAYKVDKIQVVKPSDTSVLKIEPGRDIVTLLTCTPYMINTDRLLVTGHRVPYTATIAREAADGALANNLKQWLILSAVILFGLLQLGFLAHYIHVGRLKRRVFDLVFYRVDAKNRPVTGIKYQLLTRHHKPLKRHGQDFITISDELGRVCFDKLPGNLYYIQELGSIPKFSFLVGVTRLKQVKMRFYPNRKNRQFLLNRTPDLQLKK